jgi:hypothetical protein
VNDPINDALSNLGGIFTGVNPPFAPQITDLIGFNIPGKPLISARDYFLAQMESWLSVIPMTTQWIAVIERFPVALQTSFIQSLERTDASKHGWDISTAVNALKQSPYQRIVGCLFVHGVTIPAEQYDVSSVTVPNNRGFLPGIIAGGRQTEPQSLVLEFRETNTSFVDAVIRPWSILTSHYGLVTRPGDQISRTGTLYDDKNMKTNIIILQYTRSLQNVSMIPRKTWTFYNCAPYNISDQSLEYSEEKLQILTTRWTYTNYTVGDNLYMPLGSIIQNFSENGFPNITGNSGIAKPPFSPLGGF